MCDGPEDGRSCGNGIRIVPLSEAVGMVLAHDVTEIRKKEFKGRAFRKGHIIRTEDIGHLRRLGKENLYVLSPGPDEMHEDEAALALAACLSGEGAEARGEPREGRIDIAAVDDGLLIVNRRALFEFNILGEVLCSTRHGNTMVRKGRTVAATRAIPLTVKRKVIEQAVAVGERARAAGAPVIRVKRLRKPKAGIVITGNEIFYRRVKDDFGPVISGKIHALHGEIVGIRYAPDDASVIQDRLQELLDSGADLLLATGGMSVDPDDVTRFAIAKLGARDIVYGSPVLPGAMFLVGYLPSAKCGVRSAELEKREVSNPQSEIRNPQFSDSELKTPNSQLIPILGIPACGMYHAVTVLDLVLPRVLADEKIGRRELAELGHGGLCLHCKNCRYPVCPFGK